MLAAFIIYQSLFAAAEAQRESCHPLWKLDTKVLRPFETPAPHMARSGHSPIRAIGQAMQLLLGLFIYIHSPKRFVAIISLIFCLQ